MVERSISQGDPIWGLPEMGVGNESDPNESRFSGLLAIKVRDGSMALTGEKLRQISRLNEVILVAGEFDYVARFDAQTEYDLRILFPELDAIGDLQITPLIHMTPNLVGE